MEPGRLIASGRAADIFELGPDLVLRRARAGYSLEREARVMRFARDHGYPVPAVHEVRAGGTEVVMDYVRGPTQIDALLRRPWAMARQAALLAALHRRLHAIAAPDWIDALPDGGDRLLHLDLHPLNVILTGSGPVVIDWANACAGEPLHDVALTYALLRCGEPSEGMLASRIVDAFRRRFAAAFLSHFDARDIARVMPAVAKVKATDANILDGERVALLRLAEEVADWGERGPR